MANKNGDPQTSRRAAGRRIAAMGLAVLVVLTVCLFVGRWLLSTAAERWWMGPEVFDEAKSDSAKWLASRADRDTQLRKRMFHDLRANHLEIGMTREDVAGMLGKPDEKHGLQWSYYLGLDALKLDIIVLVLTFNHSGCLTSVGWYDS